MFDEITHEKELSIGSQAFDALLPAPGLPSEQDFWTDTAHPEAYEHYLKIHKVLVGYAGAEELIGIHHALKTETKPRYLSAAGWASAEVALVRADLPLSAREKLIEDSVACWVQALERQKLLNALDTSEDAEHASAHRIALDIAVAPLIHGIVQGEVAQVTRDMVFRDCLNIAQSNAVLMRIAVLDDNQVALAAHSGFGYECNALLGFNLKFKKGWFVIPSMARSDTGIYHRHQTHDLVVVHHREGQVVNMTPVEVKAAADRRDRARYKALLVRGKMHLSVPGRYTPEQTLASLEAVYEGRGTEKDHEAADQITNRFAEMVKDYYAGESLGYVATKRSVTRFRDNAQVVAKHPGLAVVTNS